MGRSARNKWVGQLEINKWVSLKMGESALVSLNLGESENSDDVTGCPASPSNYFMHIIIEESGNISCNDFLPSLVSSIQMTMFW